MKNTLRACALLALFTTAPLLHAQVTFTINATATTTGLGYTSGSTYTFIFTTGSSFASNSSSFFSSSYQNYVEANASQNSLWSTITGTGVSGSYVRPSGALDDPNNHLRTNLTGGSALTLSLKASTDNDISDNIGITTLGGSLIETLSLSVQGGNLPSFSFPGAYVAPSSYFAAYTGTYSGFSSQELILNSFDGSPEFTVNSVTVSTTAVPEPSTYAALAGLTAFGVVLYRRRFTKNQPTSLAQGAGTGDKQP